MYSARNFVPGQDPGYAGIPYAFQVFRTAGLGQKAADKLCVVSPSCTTNFKQGRLYCGAVPAGQETHSMNEAEIIHRLAASAQEEFVLRSLADKLERAGRGTASASRFLTPREQIMGESLMRALCAQDYAFFGGYDSAERRVFQCWPQWDEQDFSVLGALRISYPTAARIDHRAVLGAILSLGLTRDCLGDILVGETSADVILTVQQMDFIARNLQQIGRSRIRIRPIELCALIIPPPQGRTIRDTVASLRLDGILSAGLSLSRDKAAKLIQAGAVQIDHMVCLKPDRQLKPDALLSVRGYGRLRLLTVSEPTKKGRLPITIFRYD